MKNSIKNLNIFLYLLLSNWNSRYELLFEDGKEVKYFDNADEFFELADYYLRNDKEREAIAQAGMKRVQSEFHTEKIVRYLDNLIETGTYKAPWAEIY